jgi:hypothetical protein
VLPITLKGNARKLAKWSVAQFQITSLRVVWVAGFEPATFCIQNRHATWLRYTQVDLIGFEPISDALQVRRFPVKLKAHSLRSSKA